MNFLFFNVVLLILCWSPISFSMKIALQTIPPFTLSLIRVLLASPILFFLIQRRKEKLPQSFKTWKRLFILGFLACGVPFTLFPLGQKSIPSALGAIITGISPIATAALGHLFIKEEGLTVRKTFGLLLGFLSLLLLFLPTVLDGQIEQDSYGILLATIAALSYASSIVYARKFFSTSFSITVPFIEIFSSIVYFLPIALFIDGPQAYQSFSIESCLAVIFLSVFCTAYAFIPYYRILSTQGLSCMAIALYISPVIGSFMGIVFNQEKLPLNAYLALLSIVLSTYLTLYEKDQKSLKTPVLKTS